ncbi:MAG: c-type cytochrome [Anaerolineales bacterium]|nr:c-type cytochrome [Anaerolineales bacterium]
MNSKLLITTILLTLIVSACGAQTPQATTEPAAIATQALPLPTETQAPATEIPSVPATEAPTQAAVTSTGISFANDVAPIFEASCNKCHGIEEVKEGLDLTTYEGVIAGSFNGAVVVPGNANESYLVQQVAEGEMPKRGLGLTDQQIQIIADWVNQGAQNN